MNICAVRDGMRRGTCSDRDKVVATSEPTQQCGLALEERIVAQATIEGRPTATLTPTRPNDGSAMVVDSLLHSRRGCYRRRSPRLDSYHVTGTEISGFQFCMTDN